MAVAEAPGRLIRVDQAAAMLGISVRKAYQLAERGELPGAVRIGERSLRVSVPHLQSWIDAHAAAAGSP